ncbi:formate/nitrite transporter family protein [Paenibacillus sp. 1011MAR3C5]|uniref:formate/nitrite transporter family protein n=1 Tax=Paenibacillus sp. 1011MAR3C5 TaxID=1675787 RepID=UPI000E6C770F|nr:formate/nitrite transporter family protein [Paenibacillus sp. 1011MAR3C5]RJE88666.1 formate/nitrite transporter family protein [Paenibacillus sp. 1011MAR3C5]
MAYVKPAEVSDMMVDSGAAKTNLPPLQMVIRGMLGGAILAFATTLAFTAVQQTSIGLAGALIFPVGFVMIVLLGLELVTGSFALIPLAVALRKTTMSRMLSAFGWAILGHLIGCGLYAALYVLTITSMGSSPDAPLAQTLISLSETKTLGYKAMGSEGMLLVILKAILCNWMVTLGVVLAFTSQSTGGKIAAMWLPILTFFAQGFEHAVVNMFVIPAGMLLGADVSMSDWWVWNQIPVLLGNFIGGALFTGILLYLSHKKLVRTPAASLHQADAPAPGLGEGRSSL